jgi:hypothetical protein
MDSIREMEAQIEADQQFDARNRGNPIPTNYKEALTDIDAAIDDVRFRATQSDAQIAQVDQAIRCLRKAKEHLRMAQTLSVDWPEDD